MTRALPWRALGGVSLCAAVGLVALPVVTVFIYSFHKGSVQVFPPDGFTLDWYGEFLRDRRLTAALGRSLVVGGAVGLLATLLGGWCGFALARGKGRMLLMLAILASLPFFVPALVAAIGLVGYYRAAGIGLGMLSVIAAHTAYAAPLAIALTRVAFERVDGEQLRAALNLGASRTNTVRLVLLPQILPAIVIAFLLCFLISWDEVLLAWYLCRFAETLPAAIYSISSSAVTPVLNVAGVLSSAISLVVLAATLSWLKRGRSTAKHWR